MQKILWLFLWGVLIIQSCNMPEYKPSAMQTVDSLDIERYMGKWYEIYRLPMRAEKNLVNVTATYTLRKDGRVDVLNAGYKHTPGGKYKKAKALAWRPNDDVPGALIVRFFGLFKSSYLVLALDTHYKWALVSTRDRDYAWILSRNPQLEQALEKELLEKAARFNIDTSRFIKTRQQWD